jgi:hypothetical protein
MILLRYRIADILSARAQRATFHKEALGNERAAPAGG